MKVLAILLLTSACLALSSAENIVCYFTSWTVYRQDNGKFDVKNIDPFLCTHILYGFVGLGDDNTVHNLDPWESDDDGLKGFSNLVALKDQNPDLKILLSMGGWNEGSQKYSKMAADPNARKTLIASVIQFLQDHKFDGFDLDWEYPGQREADPENDPANFVTLLQEFKAALKPLNYLLSAAVAGGVASMDISYNIRAVSDALDIIDVMAYDFHGAFEPFVGHYAPLHASSLDQTDEQKTLNVAAGIEHWLEQGADPKKIHLGLGTYARTFTLASADNTSLYAPTYGGGDSGPYTRQMGVLGYNEICELYNDWDRFWDDEQQVPHKIRNTVWIGYDDKESLIKKVEYGKSKGLGGYMVWSLDTDDFNGICGDGKYPLLNAIKNTIG